MANSEAMAGIDSYILTGEETVYNTEQTTVNQHFGILKNFKAKIENGNTYSRGFVGTTTGGRNIAKTIPGKIAHKLSVDFDVINWSFLKYLLGSSSGTGTITYSEDDHPPSMTLHRPIVNPGASATNQDGIWTGVVVNSITIKASVGEPISISAELLGAHRELDTSVISKVALPSVDVFSFVGADIELPNGTSIPNIIDSVEITITNNFEMLYGCGGREARNAKAGNRDYKIKFSVKYLNNDLITAVQGAAQPTTTTNPTEYATIEFNFVNGSKSCALLFNTFTFDDHAGNEEHANPIGEDLSGTAVSCTATEVE